MSIRVIAQTNIMSSDRQIVEYNEIVTLDYILKDLNIDVNTHLVFIMKNDTIVKSTTEPLMDDDLILIKVIPTGDKPVTESFKWVDDTKNELGKFGSWLYDNDLGNFFDTGNGEWNMVLGTAMVSISSAVAWVNPIVGGSLAYMGGAFLSNGSLYNASTNKSDPTVPNLTGSPYMKGGKTIIKPDGNIPIILGRHRYFPPMIAPPNIYIDGGYGTHIASNYAVRQQSMYLIGQKDLILEGAVKLGENDLPEGYKYAYGNTLYPLVSPYINVNSTLGEVTYKGYPTVEVTLPKGITAFEILFAFGEFYGVFKDGSRFRPYMRYVLEVYENIGGTFTKVSTDRQMSRWIDGGDITLQNSLVPTYVPETFASYKYEVLIPATNPPEYQVIDVPIEPTKEYKIIIKRQIDNPTQKWTGFEDLFVPNLFQYRNKTTIMGVRCYTLTETLSTYASNNYVINSLDLPVKEGLSLDDFNVIAWTNIKTYNGSGTGSSAWTTVKPSNNPAALFLYVLQGDINPKPVSDLEIDWVSLEQWYQFCEAGVAGASGNIPLQCNLVLDTASPIETILQMICGTGRASFEYNGKYSVIVDTERAFAKQLITPKNSYGFSMFRNLEQDWHGVKYSFINENTGFSPDSVICYADGYNADGTGGKLKATKIFQDSIVGVTNGDLVKRLGTYNIWLKTRRIESITTNMDWEYVLCKPGDLVKVQHDVPLLGLISCRIIGITSGTLFEVEETIPYEVGKNYVALIRKNNTEQVSVSLVNQGAPSRVLELTSAIGGLNKDDLLSIHEAGTLLGEYIVSQVEPKDDLTATLTLVNYAPEIYTSGDNLPPFVSNVYKPANFGNEATLSQGFNSNDIFGTSSNVIINTDNVVDSSNRDAIKVGEIPAILLRDETFEATEIGLSTDYYYYVKAENLKLYRSLILPNAVEELIIDKAIRNFDVLLDDSKVCYTDNNDGNTLYVYDGVTHTKIIDATVSQPQWWDLNTIGYIQDSKLYYVNLGDIANPVLFMDGVVITNYDYYNGYIGFVVNGDDALWIKEKTNTDELDKGVSIDLDIDVAQIKLAKSARIGSDYDVYYRDQDSMQSYRNSEAYRASVIKHAVRDDSSYLYISNELKMFIAEVRSLEAQQRRLEVSNEVTSSVISGFVSVAGSREIRGVSNDDLEKVARGDYIVGLVFPEKTKIIDIGAGVIYVDKGANYAYSQGNIGVEGTRLLLNANRVVVPGTITTGLLETNVLNSVERVPVGLPNAGQPLYQHDLYTGEELQYSNTTGELLRSFSPENGLWLSDGVTVGGTSPDDPSQSIGGIAKAGDIKEQPTIPIDPAKGNTWKCTLTQTTGGVKYWNRYTYMYNGVDKWIEIAFERIFTEISNATELSALNPTKGDTFKAVVTFASGGTTYYGGASYEYMSTGSWLYIADNTQTVFSGTVNLTRGTVAPGSTGFGLDSTGKLTASSAVIRGIIYAEDGEFAGTLKAGTTTANGTGFVVDGVGNVTMANLTATNGSFSGSITGSTITGGTITGSVVNGGSVNGATISGGSIFISTPSSRAVSIAGGDCIFYKWTGSGWASTCVLQATPSGLNITGGGGSVLDINTDTTNIYSTSINISSDIYTFVGQDLNVRCTLYADAIKRTRFSTSSLTNAQLHATIRANFSSTGYHDCTVVKGGRVYTGLMYYLGASSPMFFYGSGYDYVSPDSISPTDTTASIYSEVFI